MNKLDDFLATNEASTSQRCVNDGDSNTSASDLNGALLFFKHQQLPQSSYPVSHATSSLLSTSSGAP
jgi:hypothetical protein